MQARFVKTVSGATASVLLTGRQLNNVKRAAFYGAGVFWHREFRAKHFTRAGAREYGYLPRRGEEAGLSRKQYHRSYTARKAREMGHKRPLVYTGESEEDTRMARIAAKSTRTQSRVVVSLNAPNLLFRPPRSSIDMVAEMQAVSAAEEETLRQRVETELAEGFKRIVVRNRRRF